MATMTMILNIIFAYLFFKTYKRYYFLFSIIVIVAIITPHILHGHLLIPKQYAQEYSQSIIFLLDLILIYIIYFIFKDQIKKIKREKEKTEERLLDSYKYIGEANRQLNLFDKFINFFSIRQNPAKVKEKKIFNELLKTIINSVVKSDKGLIRFTEVDKKRTIKEFSYSKDGNPFIIRLSNAKIIEKKSNPGDLTDNKKIKIISSDYTNSNIKCVLCYPKKQKEDKENIDIKLLKNLIKQIHLLFIAMYSEKILNNQRR